MINVFFNRKILIRNNSRIVIEFLLCVRDCLVVFGGVGIIISCILRWGKLRFRELSNLRLYS